MLDLLEQNVDCPYCGENISVLIDQEEINDEYIEDCQVCCRPIVFRIMSDFDGDLQVLAQTENDS